MHTEYKEQDPDAEDNEAEEVVQDKLDEIAE